MKRTRFESSDPALIAGFILGLEWGNDSATNVVDFKCRGPCRENYVIVEDADGDGDDEVLVLTDDGLLATVGETIQ